MSASLAVALAVVASAGAQDRAEPTDCKRCHEEIHAEWKATRHAKAWTSPSYQAETKKKRRPRSCWSCHAPRPVLERAPKKPKVREAARAHGIDCVACHVFEGKVHGPWGAKTDAHDSVESQFFAPKHVGICMACHRSKVGPVLPLGRDFEDSGLAKKGKSCKGCHMPEVERPIAVDPETGAPAGPKREGRSHRVLGPSDAEFLRKAFAFEVDTSADDGRVRLTLENRAGHRVPGLTLRSFEVHMRVLGAKDRVLASERVTIDAKHPLGSGKTLDVSFEPEAGAKSYSVEVLHFLVVGGERKRIGVAFSDRGT